MNCVSPQHAQKLIFDLQNHRWLYNGVQPECDYARRQGFEAQVELRIKKKSLPWIDTTAALSISSYEDGIQKMMRAKATYQQSR